MNNVPNNWVSCSLEDLLITLESGSRPKGGVKGISDGTPSIGGEHLTYQGSFDWSSVRYVPEAFANSMNKGKIQTNDILIVKDGATTGKTAFVDEHFPFPKAVVNEHIFICRPSNLINPKFLFRYLTSKDGQERILENFKGSAQGGINLTFAPNTEVLLAPLNEQRRIVAKLEKLLAKVDTCKERLDKIPGILKRFRQSVLSAACSGRLTADWRENNPDVESAEELLKRIQEERRATWEKTQLIKMRSKGEEPKNDKWKTKYKELNFPNVGDLSELPEKWCYTFIEPLLSLTRRGMKTGPFGSLLKKHEHQLDGVPVLGIENITALKFVAGNKIYVTKDKANELLEYDAQPGDILISRSGTVGEVCVVPEGLGEARISTNLVRIALTLNGMLPFFFCMLFNGSPFVLSQVSDLCKGSTRDFLSQDILSSIIFSLPPLPEQQEIIHRVETLFKTADQIEQRYQKAKSYIDQLTQSILAKAFRGELVPQDPNDEPASVLLERIRAERENRENVAKTAKKPVANKKQRSKKAQPQLEPKPQLEPIQLELSLFD